MSISMEIRARMTEIEHAATSKQKMYQAHKLFKYLADQKQFMDHHKKFKDVIAAKLREFYYEQDYKEAKDWWRDIFEHDML